MHKPIVIFDFDGTMVDSSIGLTETLKLLAERNDFPVLAAHEIKPVISRGSAAMIQRVSGLSPDDAKFEPLMRELLDIYRRHGLFKNTLFPGMQELLTTLSAQDIRWGIMTNGHSVSVNAMLTNLKLNGLAGSVVCADHIHKCKPDPEGLLKVCKQMQCSPERCYYVGDAVTDIEAGKRAGMKTVAALYGYVPPDNPAENWGADYLIGTPLDLLEILHIKVS